MHQDRLCRLELRFHQVTPTLSKNQMVKPCDRLQSEMSRTLMAYHCSKFNACCSLSCKNTLTLKFCLCRPTKPLHQGQGHQYDMNIVCHELVYRHAKFQCNSLTIVRYIDCKLKSSQVWDTLEWRSRLSDWQWSYRPFVGLHSNLGLCLNTFRHNQTCIMCMTKICVTLNEGQYQYN